MSKRWYSSVESMKKLYTKQNFIASCGIKVFFSSFLIMCIMLFGMNCAFAIPQNAFEVTFDDSIENIDNFLKTYTLTDKKHLQFRQENEDYALADAMLNFTWHAVKERYGNSAKKESQNSLSNEEYKKILAEQRLWMEEGRNAVASSFSLHLSEVEAFTLAIVARTQELASKVYEKPKLGVYLYTPVKHMQNLKNNLVQGGHVLVTNRLEQNNTTHELHNTGQSELHNMLNAEICIVHGQTFSKSGNTCEIYGETYVDFSPKNRNILSSEPTQDLQGLYLVGNEQNLNTLYEAQESFATTNPMYSNSQDDLHDLHVEKNTITNNNVQTKLQANISKGWLSFYENPEGDALFFSLFVGDALYLVHRNNCENCGKGVAFQGLYRFSEAR